MLEIGEGCQGKALYAHARIKKLSGCVLAMNKGFS